MILIVGLPLCRASQVYTLWPPAWTGFHVYFCRSITGPPALSGFPFTHYLAPGTDRLPCIVYPDSGPPAKVGLPSCIEYNLRLRRSHVYLIEYLTPGLPLWSGFP